LGEVIGELCLIEPTLFQQRQGVGNAGIDP
jgi:hypothetical protein